MRILQFADLHLGVETYGRVNSTTGLSTRLDDFLTALDQLVAFALQNDVDMVLFCGDAYKSRDPSQTCQREFARRIHQLAAADIQVFLLAGNHDLPFAAQRASSVDIFHTLLINNVTVSVKPELVRVTTRKGIVQVLALPWVRRSRLLTREDTKNLTIDEINRRIEETLTAWIASQVEDIDTTLPAILAAHLWHSEATSGSEKTMTMGRDYIMLLGNLINPVFDLVALGHIHKKQVRNCPMPVVYSGSLQSIDFGDEGDEKGFYVVDLDETASSGLRVTSCEFHPVASRRFLTIRVDADTVNPTDAVLEGIRKNKVEESIVRLQIRLPAAKEGLLDEEEIRRALKAAHCIAAINKEVEREQRRRLTTHSIEEITPAKGLGLYLDMKRISRERAALILRYGEKLIREQAGAE
ncbi:MAG: exonuclease SbcCD subunit D [Dehalococcoidia bacterium]|nr:exonuclease SbcCD subunit D [Dehalococcoidia bacterium]